MGDLVKAMPAVIVMLVGLASLAFGVHWMMTGDMPFGPGGTLAALAGYVVAALVILKAFTN